MAIIPSKYQKAVYDEIQYGNGNIVVKAVAGSGKTTTIVNALTLIPKHKRILFSAFNNSIVNELKERCPDHVRVTTLHSLGWSSLKKHYGTEIKLSENKSFIIAEKLFKNVYHRSVRNAHFAVMSKLVGLYKLNLGRTKEDLIDIADKHDINYTDDLIEQTMMLYSLDFSMKDTFDFNDMIFRPAVENSIFLYKYDYVFVDECQDLNLAQQMLLDKSIKDNGRMISVGDPYQAIYGFAGADAESFNRLVEKPNTKVLPLSVCYRCSKSVVESAKDIVSDLEYFEDSPVGAFRYGLVNEIRTGDWVLCRNVKPLVILCVHLLSEGKKAFIKGSDIGKSIVRLLKGTKETNLGQALRKLTFSLSKVKNDLSKRGIEDPTSHPKYISLKEKIGIISYLGKKFKSVNEIVTFIDRIFSEGGDGIQLSTIHKSKGLENDRVFLVCPELMPSKYATQPWQIQQETNLRYVAYTRAKLELIIVENFNGTVIDFRKELGEEHRLLLEDVN